MNKELSSPYPKQIARLHTVIGSIEVLGMHNNNVPCRTFDRSNRLGVKWLPDQEAQMFHYEQLENLGREALKDVLFDLIDVRLEDNKVSFELKLLKVTGHKGAY